SAMGVRSVQDAVDTTDAALALYQHLKSAPTFTFAHAAWEARDISAGDLVEYVTSDTTGKRSLGLDCVMSEELFQTIGVPAWCDEFRPGYRWRRYRGETYQPLYAPDQPELNARARDRFPEYFSY